MRTDVGGRRTYTNFYMKRYFSVLSNIYELILLDLKRLFHAN